MNEANLTNAVLARTVLTRSDLGGALIEGADFSDAVLDLPQKQVCVGHNLFYNYVFYHYYWNGNDLCTFSLHIQNILIQIFNAYTFRFFIILPIFCESVQ